MGEVLNSRESSRAASRRRIQRVHVAALGQDVFIKPLTGSERARISDAWRELGDKPSFSDTVPQDRVPDDRACAVDEQGGRNFGDGEIDSIGEIDAVALGELSNTVQQANGLASDAVELP